MKRFLLTGLLLALAACSEKSCSDTSAMVAPTAPQASNADESVQLTSAQLPVSGYLLGIMQRPGETEASNGRNEWILRLDPESNEIYFGQSVEGKTTEVVEPYVTPSTANGGASLLSGRISVDFTADQCESDHGGLGAGQIRATVMVQGITTSEQISMCMVSDRPNADVRRPEWSSNAF